MWGWVSWADDLPIITFLVCHFLRSWGLSFLLLWPEECDSLLFPSAQGVTMTAAACSPPAVTGTAPTVTTGSVTNEVSTLYRWPNGWCGRCRMAQHCGLLSISVSCAVSNPHWFYSILIQNDNFYWMEVGLALPGPKYFYILLFPAVFPSIIFIVLQVLFF